MIIRFYISLFILLVCKSFCLCINEVSVQKKEEVTSPIWEEIKKFKKSPEIKQQFNIKDPFIKNMAGLIDTVNVANSKSDTVDRALSHFFLNVFPGGFLRFGSGDGFILLTEEKTPQLFTLIKTLCQKMEIPMPAVFLSGNKKMFNAFATSLSHDLSMIVLGQGLLKKLDDKELRSVLAHELAHVKHSHVPQQLAVALLGNLVIPLFFTWWISKLDDGSQTCRSDRYDPLVAFLKSGFGRVLIFSCSSILTTLLLLYRSRIFEAAADMTALEVTDDEQSFISMIDKIEQKVLKKKQSFEESHEFVMDKLSRLDKSSPKITTFLRWLLESHYAARQEEFDAILKDETGDHPSCKKRKEYAQEFGLARNEPIAENAIISFE